MRRPNLRAELIDVNKDPLHGRSPYGSRRPIARLWICQLDESASSALMALRAYYKACE
jgi:hypothetical protein